VEPCVSFLIPSWSLLEDLAVKQPRGRAPGGSHPDKEQTTAFTVVSDQC
jgi:hypothetical protein